MSKFITCLESTDPYNALILECEFAEEQIVQEADFMGMLNNVADKIEKLIDWIIEKVAHIKSKIALKLKNDADVIDFSGYSFTFEVFDANPFFEFDKRIERIQKMWKPFIDNNDEILEAERDFIDYMRESKNVYRNWISISKVKNALNIIEKKLKSLQDKIKNEHINERYKDAKNDKDIHEAFTLYYSIFRTYASFIKNDIDTIYRGIRNK